MVDIAGIDASITIAGLLVGGLVGLTGMGGGALMTPLLVLVFGVDPLAAVGSDVVASAVMKPVGGGVHLRRGSVHRGIVTWLVLGSVPAALAGAFLITRLDHSSGVDDAVKQVLGGVLLVAATAMLVKARVAARGRQVSVDLDDVVVKRGRTMAIGLLGGLLVGATSVGSGSVMLVLLLVLYPRLGARQLVGTDLVQAVPLVGAAAVGHLFVGEVDLAVTASLLLGSIPGVYLGARTSARVRDGVLRPVLVVVLAATGAELVGLPTVATLALAGMLAALQVLAARRDRQRCDADDAPQSELIIASAAIEK